MKIDIWSDIMCPFCYLGKRKFDKALERFEHRQEVEIRWRSFQLDPELQTDPSRSTYDYLAERKGWPAEQAKEAHSRLIARGKEVGLDYRFDRAIPANTFDAHRLSHLAAEHNLQNEAEERLFRAHFTEGENIDDAETLAKLGSDIGLPETDIRSMLESDRYADRVKEDISRARELGVQGVPFFLINEEYAVSGAQSIDLFLAALREVHTVAHGGEHTGERLFRKAGNR